MVMLPLLVSGLMAAVSVAGPMEMRGVERHCATRSLSLEERELFERQSSQPDDGQEINLGFVLHFCCGQGGECPSDAVAEKTAEDMNSLFADGKIRFNLQNISRIDDPRCTAGVTDNNSMDKLKAQFHQGNTSTLNIVYVPTNQGAGVKGMCVVPQPGMDIARGIGGRDGCVVAMDTLPNSKDGNSGNGSNGVNRGNRGNGGNGRRPGGNNGGSGIPGGLFGRLFSRQNGGGGGGNAQLSGALTTSVHETGHWLGEDHKNGGGGVSGTANIMEPVSMPNKQYSFSQDQFQRMRRMALARVNNQKAPVGNNKRPTFGDGGDNARPPFPNGDDGDNTRPSFPNGDGGDNTRPPFPNGDDGANTGGQGKPGRPTNRPTNPGFNPGPGSGPGQRPPFTGGNGVNGGPGTGDIDPDVLNFIKEVTGSDDISGLEVYPIGARAEPEAEADESGLVHIARRGGTEAEADESGLVHIARSEGTDADADESGLVHIARK